MKIRQYFALIAPACVLFLLLPVLPVLGNEDSIPALKKSLVRVRISRMREDPARPWVTEPVSAYETTGLVWLNGRIIVAAGDLGSASQIEISTYNSYKKTTAVVEMLDIQANLAVLKPDTPEALNGMLPVHFGKDPVTGEQLDAIKLDNLFEIQRTKVMIAYYETIADLGFTRLPVAVIKVPESYSQGGILSRNGKIAGLISYEGQNTQKESIPASRLNSFTRRYYNAYEVAVKQNKPQFTDSWYQPFISQGFRLEPLTDPVLRSYLKAPQKGGAVISRVIPGTSAENQLQPDDVLLSIEGIPVDERGLYRDPRLGLQDASLLFTRRTDGTFRFPSDSVTVELIREGKRQTVNIQLQKFEEGRAQRIPWMAKTGNHYLVEDGFVFTELSVPLLQREFGSNWYSNSVYFAHLFDSRRFYETGKESSQADRIVVLVEVLPTDHNAGYTGLKMEVIEKANGQRVQSVAELARIYDQSEKKGYVELILPDQKRIYGARLSRSENEAVLKKYSIPSRGRW